MSLSETTMKEKPVKVDLWDYAVYEGSLNASSLPVSTRLKHFFTKFKRLNVFSMGKCLHITHTKKFSDYNFFQIIFKNLHDKYFFHPDPKLMQ